MIRESVAGELVQLLADALDDGARVFQLHLEVHDLVDVLELAVVGQSLALEEVLDLLLVLFVVLVVHLNSGIGTFSFLRKKTRISWKAFSLPMNLRHSSILICMSLLISSSRFRFSDSLVCR